MRRPQEIIRDVRDWIIMARFFPSGKVSSRSRFLVRGILYICLVFLAPAACRTASAGAAESGLAQPFGLDLLEKVKPDQSPLPGGEALLLDSRQFVQ